jgi:hypothetical protein
MSTSTLMFALQEFDIDFHALGSPVLCYGGQSGLRAPRQGDQGEPCKRLVSSAHGQPGGFCRGSRRRIKATPIRAAAPLIHQAKFITSPSFASLGDSAFHTSHLSTGRKRSVRGDWKRHQSIK